MWFVMEKVQNSYFTQERLLMTINDAGAAARLQDENRAMDYRSIIDQLIVDMADESERMRLLNRIHGNRLPLCCACLSGDVETVRLLIRHGAEVNQSDGFHRYPIHYASEQSFECVRALVEEGASVRVTDGNSNTPLHWAAYRNHTQIVRYLLDRGANPNALGVNSETALGWAALKGHLETVAILLEYNCRPNTVNGAGSSPLSQIARTISIGIWSSQEEACLELLVKALGQFDLRRAMGMDLETDPDLKELVLPYCVQPRSLKQFCRFAIRSNMGPGHLPSRIQQLQLPHHLNRYLLLE